MKARYCLATGDLDSARVYYVRLSKSKQEAYRLSGCEGLVRVYLQKNQVDSVRKYFEIFNELQAVETLQRATEQLQASHMHAEVKRQKRQQKELRPTAQGKTDHLWFAGIVFSDCACEWHVLSPVSETSGACCFRDAKGFDQFVDSKRAGREKFETAEVLQC